MLTKRQRRMLEYAKRHGSVRPRPGHGAIWAQCFKAGWITGGGVITDEGRSALNEKDEGEDDAQEVPAS